MRRYSDPDIFKETVKQKNAIKQGDILPSECNVDDFERYSLNALVFVQSLSGACETLVKQLSEYNDEYNVMRMKVIVVTNDDPQQFITNNQIKTTILQDVNQSIAKNFGLDSANNQNVFLILPSFQVAKVIASISTANFGPVLKKEAVEFINLCDVAEEVN
jgi:alkyl hydroperoxide reductase subunit AhpC